eukprot:2815476-Alexandrium_andersonii.AAC.1
MTPPQPNNRSTNPDAANRQQVDVACLVGRLGPVAGRAGPRWQLRAGQWEGRGLDRVAGHERLGAAGFRQGGRGQGGAAVEGHRCGGCGDHHE